MGLRVPTARVERQVDGWVCFPGRGHRGEQEPSLPLLEDPFHGKDGIMMK